MSAKRQNTLHVSRQVKDGNNTRQSIDGVGRVVCVTPVMCWQLVSRGVLSSGNGNDLTPAGVMIDSVCRTECFKTGESVGSD